MLECVSVDRNTTGFAKIRRVPLEGAIALQCPRQYTDSVRRWQVKRRQSTMGASCAFQFFIPQLLVILDEYLFIDPRPAIKT
ncbi:hypothetical protein D3C77_644930 [compost metagenome]